VSPRQVDRNWQIPPPAPDTDALMRAAVQGGTWAIGRTLDSLLPTHPDYRALEAALVRALAATPPDDPLALAARERRLTAIRADLERWRWLPREVPGRRIEVRIPFQRLDFHLGDGRVERFTAIVGAPRTTTNSLVDVARSVVFNPTWIAPRRIALDELLPSLRSDPAAMEAQGFELVAADGTAVPPTAVDPASLTRSGFAWSVRQRAGERNALGRVKFPLTNRWAIFLHDTANRQLFGREMRALSHGCVRVQDPLRLARLMLADTGGWTDARIAEATVPGGAERGVRVASPVPVWLVYLVTEPDAAGGLSVAPDIYGLDTALVKALDQPRAPEAAFGIRLNTRVAMP
jgi:murein L,D-transpeptidase YcbB/YkuD